MEPIPTSMTWHQFKVSPRSLLTSEPVTLEILWTMMGSQECDFGQYI